MAAKDRPIIFSGSMIRALLDNRKTQTRRILTPQNISFFTTGGDAKRPSREMLDAALAEVLDLRQVDGDIWTWVGRELPEHRDIRPRWQAILPYAPGDRLWVRENWKPHSSWAGWKPRDIPQTKVFYVADDSYAPSNTPWVPSIHMPRWASRLTLTVTDTRVQRLQDISEDDAIAEGITTYGQSDRDGMRHFGYSDATAVWPTATKAFSILWETINGPGAWEANPWVVALTFTVDRRNIDQAAN